MLRVLLPALVGVAVVGVWIYCVFDVIATDGSVTRHLPKPLWLLLVVVLPLVGSLAWLALGRPPYAHWRPGGVEPPRNPGRGRREPDRPRGPEDDPGWPERWR